MHELSVTESLLEISLRHLKESGEQRVTDLFLVIGELSSIVDDSVQFYWDIIAKGTPAEESRLHFKRIPAEMECLECGKRYKPDEETLACPTCGGTRIRVAAGDEFRLDSITVDSNPQVNNTEKSHVQKHPRG